MMNTGPQPALVSVVVPAYNAQAFLPDAIRSVQAQTWPNWEMIIVDDGSTDDTLAIARSFALHDERIVVLAQENGGVSRARNSGIAEARGEVVAFLDADDCFLPGKLASQMDHLLSRPDCDLVYSDYHVGDESLELIELRSVHPIDAPMSEAFAYRTPFAPVSVLMRRTLVDAIGGFDDQLHGCEDRDYWIRAERRGRFCYVPGAVAIYRSHLGQKHRDLTTVRAAQRAVIMKNYPRGSSEWRIAQACLAYSEARVAWGRRRRLHVAKGLARSIWYSRSWRMFRSVQRWGGYG